MNKNKTDRGRLSWVVTCWSVRGWTSCEIRDDSGSISVQISIVVLSSPPSLRSPFAIIAAAVVCYAPIEADAAARFVHT